METLTLYLAANKTHQSRGFTLIEVVVALAILTAGFSVIFKLFQQSGITATRVVATQQQVDAEQSIFNVIKAVNPAKNNSGKNAVGDIQYQWQADPMSPLLRARSDDGTNRYHVQLYKVTVDYQLNNQSYQFEFEQLGWSKQ